MLSLTLRQKGGGGVTKDIGGGCIAPMRTKMVARQA